MYPTKEQIKNRMYSVEKMLSALNAELSALENSVSILEKEQKALYLLNDLVKE